MPHGLALPVRCLTLFIICAYPLVAAKLVPGESYELELPDGSRLSRAVYRGEDAGADTFELASVIGRVKLKEYRVVLQPTPLPWFIFATPAVHLPLNQRELGFAQGLGVELGGSIPIFPRTHWAWPRLTILAGFVRYSGSRALLSGPELAAGPNWILPLRSDRRYFFSLSLLPGVGFYELMNLNLNEKFSQTTFIAFAELGFGLRFTRWGLIMSYLQGYLHDKNLPLASAGLRLGAVYFGGDV